MLPFGAWNTPARSPHVRVITPALNEGTHTGEGLKSYPSRHGTVIMYVCTKQVGNTG